MSNFSLSRIEEILSERRGNSFRLRPLDWATLENWRVKGVPFEAVVEGIDAVFRQAAENPRAKRGEITLFHCREAVEKAARQFAVRTPSAPPVAENPQTFAEISAEKQKVLNYLDEIAESLKNLECETPFDQAVLRIGLRFGKIRAKFAADDSASLEDLENTLNALDAEFSGELAALFTPETVEAAKNDVEKHLRPYKNKMTEDVYRETLQTLLSKKLRERSQIPRLNLFFLS